MGERPSRDQVAMGRWDDGYLGGLPLIDALACADRIPKGEALSPLRYAKKGTWEQQELLRGGLGLLGP